MRLIAAALTLCLMASPRAVAQEVGDKLMPKADAVANKKGREVPWPSDLIPFVVRKVDDGGLVGDGGFVISRQHAVPLLEAEAYYDRMIADHPFDAKAYRYRGIARRETGQWSRAFSDFDMAIELAPDDADNFCDRGIAHSLQREHVKAIADFEEAIRVGPDSTRALMWRAEYWFGSGDNDKAIEDFSRVIRIDATVPRVFIRRACAWNRAGDFEKALSDFEEAIRIDPDDPYGFKMLSWFCFRCEDPRFRNGDLAIKHATRFCELTEWKSPEALDFLAEGHALKGDYARAIELLNRAIELGADPDSFGAVIEQHKKRIQ